LISHNVQFLFDDSMTYVFQDARSC